MGFVALDRGLASEGAEQHSVWTGGSHPTSLLLHELAHELAHQGAGQPEKSLPLRELEAEATSFVVAAILGLESVGARDYLLTYAVGTDELRAALSSVQHLTRRVLAVVAPDERPALAVA